MNSALRSLSVSLPRAVRSARLSQLSAVRTTIVQSRSLFNFNKKDAEVSEKPEQTEQPEKQAEQQHTEVVLSDKQPSESEQNLAEIESLLQKEREALKKAQDEYHKAHKLAKELETKVKEVEAKAKEQESKASEYKDHLLRALAEQENIRTRAATDVKNAKIYAISSFAKDLLEVADTLTMAAKSVATAVEESNDPQFKSLYEGVLMTDKVLAKVLSTVGVSKFESLGKPFDPNIHDGLFQYPDPSKEPGSVGQVMKEGYMIHERVLRPANVGTIQKVK